MEEAKSEGKPSRDEQRKLGKAQAEHWILSA